MCTIHLIGNQHCTKYHHGNQRLLFINHDILSTYLQGMRCLFLGFNWSELEVLFDKKNPSRIDICIYFLWPEQIAINSIDNKKKVLFAICLPQVAAALFYGVSSFMIMVRFFQQTLYLYFLYRILQKFPKIITNFLHQIFGKASRIGGWGVVPIFFDDFCLEKLH